MKAIDKYLFGCKTIAHINPVFYGKHYKDEVDMNAYNFI